MSDLLEKLKALDALTAFCEIDGELQWVLPQSFADIQKTNQKFFYPYIKLYRTLDFAYEVMCTQLARDFTLRPNSPEFTERLKKAMVLSELLRHLCENFLFVPSEVERFAKEQEIYLSYLIKKRNNDAPKPTPIHADELPFFPFSIRKIRKHHSWTNIRRLIFLRSRFLWRKILPFLAQNNLLRRLLVDLDKVLTPALLYLGWIFFAPRLFANLFILFKHVIPHPWMSESERNMGWIRRLIAQTERRWSELFNDLVWFIAGLLTCYLFLGAMAPIGVYVGFACYGYDIFLAGLFAAIRIYQLKDLQKSYDVQARELADVPENREKIQALRDYCQLQQQYIDLEVKKLLLALFVAIGVCFSFGLTLPFLAVASPLLPLIGATLFLGVTVLGYILGQRFEAQRPTERLKASPRFFTAANAPKEGTEPAQPLDSITPSNLVYN